MACDVSLGLTAQLGALALYMDGTIYDTCTHGRTRYISATAYIIMLPYFSGCLQSLSMSAVRCFVAKINVATGTYTKKELANIELIWGQNPQVPGAGATR